MENYDWLEGYLPLLIFYMRLMAHVPNSMPDAHTMTFTEEEKKTYTRQREGRSRGVFA